MVHLLFVLPCLAQLVQATPTNITISGSCPPLDGTSRSVWSILVNCVLTLLICVWHAVHLDVPEDDFEASLMFKIMCCLGAFFIPEAMIATASMQWWEARDKVFQFREEGYEWSMTHSFFAEMGGFACPDDKGVLRKVTSLNFLERCRNNEIANPDITVEEIKDKSKSDALGKAILALQLVWFMLQVVVRGWKGLTITLIELDTVCMAVLSLLIIFLWWDKPLRPERPHILYLCREVKVGDLPTSSSLSAAWKPGPGCVERLVACTYKPLSTTVDEETRVERTVKKSADSKSRGLMDWIDADDAMFTSLCVSWLILGGLHLIAWNFDFLTETERILWRIASLVLAGGSPVFFALYIIARAHAYSGRSLPSWLGRARLHICVFAGTLGIVSRALLVGLMLASLRAIPCSARETVSWTAYIPHIALT